MVYLCGPISGLTAKHANRWREIAEHELGLFGVGVFNPVLAGELANEGVLGDGSGLGHLDPLLTEGGIYMRDQAWVRACDVVLANFEGSQKVSQGSLHELGWASILNKPIVAVYDKNHDHLFNRRCATAICANMEEAIEATLTLLGVK